MSTQDDEYKKRRDAAAINFYKRTKSEFTIEAIHGRGRVEADFKAGADWARQIIFRDDEINQLIADIKNFKCENRKKQAANAKRFNESMQGMWATSDGFAGCNLAEPSEGDLERVYTAYKETWSALKKQEGHFIKAELARRDLEHRLQVAIEALEYIGRHENVLYDDDEATGELRRCENVAREALKTIKAE